MFAWSLKTIQGIFMCAVLQYTKHLKQLRYMEKSVFKNRNIEISKYS